MRRFMAAINIVTLVGGIVLIFMLVAGVCGWVHGARRAASHRDAWDGLLVRCVASLAAALGEARSSLRRFSCR